MSEPVTESVDAENVQVIDFDDIFDAYMEVNQKAWKHDRSSTVGASEVWKCLRQIWFEKRGKEFQVERNPDADQNWGAMERGNIIENHYVVPGMRLGMPRAKSLPPGLTFELAGSDQDTLVTGKNSATPDGIIQGLKPGVPVTIRTKDYTITIDDIESDCIAVEIKSIDPRANLTEERVAHRGQAQVQLGILREITPYRPVYAIVLYVDASFLNFTPFVVKFDPDVYAAAKERAGIIWRVDDPMMIEPEGRFDGSCEKCPFSTACGAAILQSMPPETNSAAEQGVVDVLDPQIQEFFKLKAAAEEAGRRFEIVKEGIKHALTHNRRRKVEAPTWSVTWFPVKGKKSLDLEAVEKAGIDLSPYYKNGNGHEQLRITDHLNKKPKAPRKKKETP